MAASTSRKSKVKSLQTLSDIARRPLQMRQRRQPFTNDDSQDISWSSDSETLAIQSGESDVKLYNKSGLTIKRTLSGAHNTDVTCIEPTHGIVVFS